MPDLSAEISGIVQGDKVDINVSIADLPGPITKCWFTVKNKLTDADADALIQKQILVADGDIPGTGAILDDGTGNGIAIVRIDLRNVDTVKLINGKVYYFDLQVLQDGEPYTPWAGLIKLVPERTKRRTLALDL